MKDGGGTTLSFANTGTIWSIKHYADNYYKIYTERSGVKFYFDVQNAYDIENNSIILYTATSYTDAQTWKILHQSDGTNDTYLIVPRLSLTRGITKDNTSTKLTASPTPLIFERLV